MSSDSHLQKYHLKRFPFLLEFVFIPDTILRYDSVVETGSRSKERPIMKENALA